MPLAIPTEWRKMEPAVLRDARWRARSWMVNDPHNTVDNARFLAGSGRSGTTWLQEIACRAGNLRPIFEPFFADRVKTFTNLPQGWYIDPDVKDDELAGRVRGVLTGEHRSPWSDHLGSVIRKGPVDGRVVKDIRTLPWLGWLATSFPELRIAHVIRHPLAVASSSTDLGWKATHLDRMIGDEALVENHLRDQIDFLRAVDTDWERAVAGWCIENQVAIRETREFTNVARFSYETLVANETEVQRYLTHFRITPSEDADVSRASKLSRPNSPAKKVGYAKPYWKSGMDPDKLAAAMAIIQLFGLGDVFGEDGEVDFSAI